MLHVIELKKNNMKTKIYFLFTILWFALQTYAQKPQEIKNNEVEGFYITVSDFSAGKLTLPTDKQHNGDKIKLNQFFISPDIISIEQDKKTVFNKDSIFAIHLTNGKNYRFINRNPFLMADTSSLYIYTYKTTKTIFRTSGPHRRSKEVPVTYYYFSLAGQKAVYKLTLANVRKYALADPATHIAVCNKFTTDDMLYQINPQTGRFDLNETILSVVN
jgi:hypothetical protein